MNKDYTSQRLNYRAKRAARIANIGDLFESKTIENELINEANQEIRQQESNVGLERFHKSKRKALLRETVEKHKEASEKDINLLSEAFGKVVFNSTYLDEGFKADWEEVIIEESAKIFKYCIGKGMIDFNNLFENKSPLVNAVFFRAINEEEEEEDPASELATKKIEDTVKEKVKETLEVEKEIAKENEEVNKSGDDEEEETEDSDSEEEVEEVEEEKDESTMAGMQTFSGRMTKSRRGIRESQTLWRSLVQANVKNGFLSEDGKLNDTIIAESIIQYTLLESLNTMNLISFNPSNIRDLTSIFLSIKK